MNTAIECQVITNQGQRNSWIFQKEGVCETTISTSDVIVYFDTNVLMTFLVRKENLLTKYQKI